MGAISGSNLSAVFDPVKFFFSEQARREGDANSERPQKSGPIDNGRVTNVGGNQPVFPDNPYPSETIGHFAFGQRMPVSLEVRSQFYSRNNALCLSSFRVLFESLGICHQWVRPKQGMSAAP